jgi:predicted nucleic acid-binding Zn ribbon protein
MVFQAIPSKFSCATFQKPSTTSHFVPLFLAQEEIVIGFVTPRLACFICSSLILQGSWSDHCNLKKRKRKRKRHSSMVCESWWAPDGIG